MGDVKQAESVDQLRELLQTEGGEVIFTTIEKFRLQGPARSSIPVCPRARNIIVIADEAHRSQYGFTEGFARYLAEALPNAMRLGFTGTPISLSGADTVEVFGDLIHTYDIQQSQEDQATVPIYYEPRQVKLASDARPTSTRVCRRSPADARPGGHASRSKSPLGSALARRRRRAKERRRQTWRRDLLAHFLDRTATLKGKAMIVCMGAQNCVRLYEALTALPGLPRNQDRDDRQPGRRPARSGAKPGTSPPKRSAKRSRSAWSIPTTR